MDDFEINNGFLGMQRDVVLKLCILLWFKTSSIKAVFAMCAEEYAWRKHPHFVRKRPKNIPASFRADNKDHRYELAKVELEEICYFDRSGTAFLDVVITKGVFLWTTHVNYGTDKHFGLNGCSVDIFLKGRGSNCSFFLGRDCGTLTVELAGVRQPPRFMYFGAVLSTRLLFGLEVDVDARTLSLLVGGHKLCRVITHIRPPLLLGVFGYNNQSFASVSLHRLPSPIPFPRDCEFYHACY